MRRVAVIGSGVGGLSCAVQLARAGYEVDVFERLDTPGGYATCFQRGAYRFDASLHRIDAAGPDQRTGRLLASMGISLDLAEGDCLREEVWPDLRVRIPHGSEAWIESFSEVFPGDAEGLRGLMAWSHRIYEQTWELMERPHISRELLDLQALTALEVLDRYLSNPRARVLVGGIGHYLGTPLERLSGHALLVLLWGYHGERSYYIRGGSGALTSALVDALTAAGGRLHLSRPVEQVRLRGHRAEGLVLEGGERVDADWVISNLAPGPTFDRLVPGGGSERYRKRLAAMPLSNSAHKLWLGLRGPLDWPYETVLHTADGRMGVHASAAVDPSCAPDGHAVLSVTLGVPPDATPLSSETRGAIQAALIERLVPYVPNLRDRIEVASLATPQHFAHYSGAPGGAILGFSSTPQQATLRRLGARTPVQRLLLASGWVRPGSGLSGVLVGGRLAAQRVMA